MSVSRSSGADRDTLVIDGVITRFEEGNAALRYLIGMGAGSSYFDATTRFRDGTGAVVGETKTDKNSWVLGGALAATQTPETYMTGAAKKIADEVEKMRK